MYICRPNKESRDSLVDHMDPALANFTAVNKKYIILHAFVITQWTQNICITFVQCWSNVKDVGPTLYKCYTNVLCLLGSWFYAGPHFALPHFFSNNKPSTKQLYILIFAFKKIICWCVTFFNRIHFLLFLGSVVVAKFYPPPPLPHSVCYVHTQLYFIVRVYHNR